jgi:hypothetical protein
MASGATHAALTQHFATAGSNAADISAKVGSHSTQVWCCTIHGTMYVPATQYSQCVLGIDASVAMQCLLVASCKAVVRNNSIPGCGLLCAEALLPCNAVLCCTYLFAGRLA